ncbi:MlaD family protein [Nocardia sp. NPDC049149]|uniref:MlaD family protein n=1 Tax=Nocardia sp. NPDC049149 TaxID=3364315 RepID=UPI003718F4E5
MKLGSLASLGGIAAITVLGASYLTFDVVRADPFAEYTHASMVLKDSGGLAVGSPILLTGIPVGKVTSVDSTMSGVEVGFRVNNTDRLPTNSTITIEQLSGLGEPYVQFKPIADNGPYLKDGQRLDTSEVLSPRSIPEVARLFSNTLNQLDPVVVGSLVSNLGQSLDGTAPVIPGLTRAGDLLASTIMSREPRIAELLRSFQFTAGDMQWTGPGAEAGAPALVRFGESLNALVESVGRLTSTGRNPEEYLEPNGTVPFLQKLTEWLNKVGPDLKETLPVLQPLLEAVNSVAPKIDISALISQALASTDDDAVKVRVTVK